MAKPRKFIYKGMSDPKRNCCPKCDSSEHTERRNYDMMWGEAELWCGKCNEYIRELDYG